MDYGEACFKLDTTLRSYEDAASFCTADNTNITSITNAFQEAFVENILLRAGVASAWIGLETQEVHLDLTSLTKHDLTWLGSTTADKGVNLSRPIYPLKMNCIT